MNVALSEQVSVGGQATTIRLSGVEHPQAMTGSYALEVSPAVTGLSRATEIVVGPNFFIHYALLDTLQAKSPSVKHWIVVNANSSLGVDPLSLTPLSAQDLSELTDLKKLGSGHDNGVAVTRYEGTLSLRQAAESPELQQLLAHLPSSEAAILSGEERVEVAAGADGYIHAVSSLLTVPFPGGVTLKVSIAATFDNFDHRSARIVAPPGSQVMTLVSFDRLVKLTATADESALLDMVVLEPSQLGAGYTLSQIPGGQLVQGETTLDFCNLTYPSESLRTARLQVVYEATNGEVNASNEVVTYKPGGAQKALQEVVRAATACPNGRVKNPPTGVTDLIRHTQVVRDPRLLPGSVAIVETDTGTVNGKRVTVQSMDVYQVRGNVLSGVYGNGRSAAAVRAVTLRAAEQSAANLKRHVAPAPKPVPSALTA